LHQHSKRVCSIDATGDKPAQREAMLTKQSKSHRSKPFSPAGSLRAPKGKAVTLQTNLKRASTYQFLGRNSRLC
jgi:hypothetical protein